MLQEVEQKHGQNYVFAEHLSPSPSPQAPYPFQFTPKMTSKLLYVLAFYDRVSWMPRFPQSTNLFLDSAAH